MCLFCWTQRKIFWRMWETYQFWGTIDFHSIFFSYYGSQWCPKTAWLQTFFKISSFVFGITKTFTQVWNYLRVSKWWQNFYFGVNYPFKYVINVLCYEKHWCEWSYVNLLILYWSLVLHCLGSVRKEIKTLIQQGCIKQIKSDSEDIYNVTKYLYFK